MNRRHRAVFLILVILTIILFLVIFGQVIGENQLKADFSRKNQPPTSVHPFGTDWLGRDMLFRTIKGLSISLTIGITASLVSAIMAVLIGASAGVLPKFVDQSILWLIDLVMGIPHLILLILISFAVGRGVRGILIGIAITHWTNLARVVRSEVLQIRNEHYIKTSRQLGKGNFFIIKKHILPHILPHILVGVILMFPHGILHEAAVTFLGFGLSPEQPAIGIILSESMKYLSSGMWWLAVLPGLSLIIIVILFEQLGDHIKALIDPKSAQD